jgi:hypothetical protein
MVDNNHTQPSENETSKKVFVTSANVLSEEQRQSLTDEEKAFEASCTSRGVWLELFCPNDACFTEEERVNIPVFCEDPNVGNKLWLELFCPNGSCEVNEAHRKRMRIIIRVLLFALIFILLLYRYLDSVFHF